MPGYGEPQQDWQQWWRVLFGMFLALALVVGLYVSLFTGSPASTQQAAPEPPPEAPPEEPEPAPADAGGEDGPAGEPEPEPAPEDDGDADEGEDDEGPDEELLEEAPDPSATTVQVLDAGGGGEAVRAAADVIEDLGYDVVNITSSRVDVGTTTVLYVGEDDTAARALRERDPRFAQVEANEVFSAAVDLHVLVGADWS